MNYEVEICFMRNTTHDPNFSIEKRCFSFAVSIVKYALLIKAERHYEIASQVIRSGTSIGANMREATNGYSKADFIYKLGIAQKEAAETIYWLEIMQEIRIGHEEDELIKEATQIFKIIKTISLNTKKNNSNS